MVEEEGEEREGTNRGMLARSTEVARRRTGVKEVAVV